CLLALAIAGATVTGQVDVVEDDEVDAAELPNPLGHVVDGRARHVVDVQRQVDELVGQLLEVLLPPRLEVVVPGGTTLVDQHGGQPGVLCRGSSQDVPGGHLCREEGGAVPCTDRIHRQRNGEHRVVRGNHGLPC